MKAKMSYKSKKIAIITAIILVLIGGISIGTYFYIRGNTDAEATTGNNTTINNGIIDEQGDDSENNNQIINETSDETNTTENGSTNESNSSTDENSSSNESNSGSSGESGNDSTGGTTNGSSSNGGNNANQNDDADVPNEEYTQIDYIETGNQILVSEGLAVGWINADLSKDNVSTKIDVVKPSLELNKTAEIGSINETDNSVQTGSKITYNITVTNTSSDADAKNVTVTDMVPEGTALDEETPISNDGTIENDKITWNVDVPKNSSVTVSFTVVVTAESGEIRNAAVVDGKDTPETENPVIEADKIATSEDEIVRNGSTITYTITVTNKSNVNAITSVKDTVPEGTTLKEVKTEGSSVNEREIVWNNVALEAGETKTFTFDVTVDEFDGESKIIKNVAVVGNDETTETETEVHYPVISSVKTADKGSVKVGETLTYTITLTNSGIVDGNVKVVDSSPIGTTFDAERGVTVSNQEGEKYSEEELNAGINVTVPAGGTVTVTFTVTVNEGVEGSIINKATIDDGTPTDEENPSVDTPVIVTEKTAEVNGEVSSTVEKGDVITYTIKITNTGSVAGISIVKDTVPTGTSYVEGSLKIGEEVQNEDAVAKFFGEGLEVEVAQGETLVSFQVTVDDVENVLENGDTISNTAYVNDEPTNETETTYQEPVFESKKEANKGSVSVGEELEYTITVKNTGSATGTAVVSDNAPTGTHFKENSTVTVSNSEKTYTTAELTQGIPVELDAGETAKVTFTVVVNESAEGAIINKATVNGDETGEEENPETQTPIINATKTATANGKTAVTGTEVEAGDIITYTITVTNTGDVVGEAKVADEIPEGTTFVEGSIKVDDVATNYSASDLKEGIPVEVKANGETTVSFDVTVGDLDNGATIRNVATVNDKNTPETETEYQEPIITSEKTSNKTAVVVGEEIEYTITAYNSGYADGKAIIKDTIPEGTRFVEGSIVVDGVAKPELTAEDLANGIEVNVEAATKGVEGEADIAGEATVTFKVVVEEGAEGSIINKATVNDTPTEEIKNPVISATKTATANGVTSTNTTVVEQGDTITYTITVTNTGDVAGSATVTDEIPEGTTFVEGSIKVDDVATNYFASDLKEGIPVEVKANGETTVSFDVTVGDLDNGATIKNVATVNDKNTPETETEYQEPIITSEKTSNKTAVVVSEEIEYTITAYNSGYADGKAIIKDTIPEGTRFVEGSIVVDGVAKPELTAEDLANGIEVNVEAATKGTESEADIAGEATVTFKVVVEEGAEGSIINKATVNDTPTEEIKNPVISATKTATANGTTAVTGTEVEAGDTITYTITVTNTGDVAGKATVADTIPEGTTFVTNSIKVNGTVTEHTAEDLAKGIEVEVPAKVGDVAGETTVSFDVTVGDLDNGDTIRNVATVNGEYTPETETEYQEPIITSEKTSNKSAVVVGEEIEYTITAYNNGYADGKAIIKDTIPEGTSFVAGSIVVDGIANSELTAEDLANGIEVNVEAATKGTEGEADIAGEATVTFKVVVEEGAEGSIINKATVNDTPTEEIKNPVISATKTATANGTTAVTGTEVEAGDTITYTITVTNTGDVAGKATVADTIPEGTTFVNGSIKVNGTVTEHTAEDLAKGIEVEVPAKVGDVAGETTVSFDVTVGDLNNGDTIRNVATVNGSDTPETETEYQEPIITSEKTSNKSAVVVGEEIEYTITAYNNGYADGKAIIKDTIPTGTSFVEGSIVVDGVANSELTAEDLANGIEVNVEAATKGTESEADIPGEATVTFKVVVEEGAEGSIINKATVNDTPTEEIKNPVISATKTATANGVTSTNETVVKQGDTITYTITVTNTGDIAGKATVADTIPGGTTFVTNSIKVNGTVTEHTADDLAKGIEVEVPAKVGDVAGETTVSFDVTVGDLDNGDTIKNVATVNGNDTPETETEYQEPVISQNKTADKTAVVEGETITYTITVTNNGSAEGTAIVKDTIPENTTFVDGSIVVAGVANSELTAEDLASGIEVNVPAKLGEKAGTTTVTFQVTVNSGATGTISNKAYVNDNPTEEVKNPVISANKVADKAEVEAGDTITYTITVTNTGDVAGKATVVDTIPEGTTFVNESIKVNGAVTEHTADDLAKGIEVEVPAKVGDVAGETTVSFDVTVGDLDNGDTIRNVATVNGSDTPETETEYQEPIITSEKTSNKSAVVVGEEIEYTITAYNNGYADGKAIIKDTIPEGTSFVAGSIVVDGIANSELTAEDLANGIEVNVEAATKGTEGEADIAGEATVTFKVVVEEGAEGSIINKATVNDTPTEEVKNPVLNTTKTATANGVTSTNETVVKQGDTITYTITVTNTGDVAGSATVADTIPGGTTFVTNSIKVNGAVTEYTVDDLAKGIEVEVPAKVGDVAGETTVSFDVTVGDLDNGDTIRNVATVNGEDTPETETEYQEPIITSEKTSNKSAVVVGEEIEYTITAYNNGYADGKAVIKDTIPTGTSFVAGSIVVDGIAKPELTAENLANGIEVNVEAATKGTEGEADIAGEATVTFKVVVEEGAKGSIINKATVNETPTEEVKNPVISATKTATVGETTAIKGTTVKQGDTITYTITVTNTGDVAGKATVADTIPEGTTFVGGSIVIDGASRADLTEEDLGNGISVQVTTLKPITISFKVTVNDLTDGDTIRNVATVNGEDTPETETKYQEPVISQSKSTDKTVVVAGETITYTITATNTGSLAGNAIIRDTIPTNTTFVVNSIKVNGEATEYTAENLANGIEVSVPAKSGEVAGETTVTFQVTVNSGATGTISNKAYVNDNPTEEVETPVITANKQASETRVEVGDTITYTITLRNNSNVDGKVTVKDSNPENTTFVEGSIAINDVKDSTKTLENLTNGIEIEVPAKGTATVSFDVTVNEGTTVGTDIKNTASVNDVPTNETTTTVVEPTLEISKSAATILDTDDNGIEIPGQSKDEAEIGDIIVYTITVKNTSDLEADVNVTDTLPTEVDFVNGSIKVENGNSSNVSYNPDTRTISYNGTLAGNTTLTITFRAKVNTTAEVGKPILNIAYVNDKPTNETTTTVVKKVTVTTTAQTMNSLDLVLVLDVSGSMGTSGEINNLKTAAENLVNRVFSSETNSTISLITYSDTAKIVGTYEYNDKATLVGNPDGYYWERNGIIDNLTTGGGTNIYDALDKANTKIDQLLRQPNAENRKRVVVFLTDGSPTFYYENEGSNWNPDYPTGDIVNVNAVTDSTYKNNLRPNILEQASELKTKSNTTVYAVGLGINDLKDDENHIQYAEKYTQGLDTSIFNGYENKGDRWNPTRYYYMYEKTYAKYILNNISSSGSYMETSDLDTTFDDILSSQTTNKYSYEATTMPVTITIPETRTIIDDEVTVQIGDNGREITYTLRQLSGNGVNGLTYTEGVGFTWVINSDDILDENLYISYKVEGVAEDNQ